jgi:hypothetical protein
MPAAPTSCDRLARDSMVARGSVGAWRVGELQHSDGMGPQDVRCDRCGLAVPISGRFQAGAVCFLSRGGGPAYGGVYQTREGLDLAERRQREAVIEARRRRWSRVPGGPP